MQNPLAVHILTRIIAGDLPITGTGGDDRNLMAEIDKAFQNGGRALHGLPCLFHIRNIFEPDLPLAVIAHAARLQNRRGADRLGGGFGFSGTCDIGIGGHFETKPSEKFFLGQAILRDCQGSAAGMNGADLFENIER